MFKDIFTDIWLNYRGRFLCSLTGLVIASLFLTVGFFRTLFLLLFVGGTWQNGWTGFCRRVIINNRPA